MFGSSVSLFILTLTIMFLFIDIAMMIYIVYLYRKQQIKNAVFEMLLIILLIIYIIKFFSVIVFIPVIIYLTNQNFNILESIDKTSYSSFVNLRKDNPKTFLLILFSYVFYITGSVTEFLVTKLITDSIDKLNLNEIKNEVNILKRINSTFLFLYLAFGIVSLILYSGEKVVEKVKKRNEQITKERREDGFKIELEAFEV